jgi:hypothetical protein
MRGSIPFTPTKKIIKGKGLIKMRVKKTMGFTEKEVKIIDDFSDLISSTICYEFGLTTYGQGCKDCPLGDFCNVNFKTIGEKVAKRVPDLVFEDKIYQEECEGE